MINPNKYKGYVNDVRKELDFNNLNKLLNKYGFHIVRLYVLSNEEDEIAYIECLSPLYQITHYIHITEEYIIPYSSDIKARVSFLTKVNGIDIINNHLDKIYKTYMVVYSNETIQVNLLLKSPNYLTIKYSNKSITYTLSDTKVNNKDRYEAETDEIYRKIYKKSLYDNPIKITRRDIARHTKKRSNRLELDFNRTESYNDKVDLEFESDNSDDEKSLFDDDDGNIDDQVRNTYIQRNRVGYKLEIPENTKTTIGYTYPVMDIKDYHKHIKTSLKQLEDELVSINHKIDNVENETMNVYLANITNRVNNLGDIIKNRFTESENKNAKLKSEIQRLTHLLLTLDKLRDDLNKDKNKMKKYNDQLQKIEEQAEQIKQTISKLNAKLLTNRDNIFEYINNVTYNLQEISRL